MLNLTAARRLLFAFAFVFAASACSDSPRTKGKINPNGSNPNGSSNSGNNVATTCGNGTLDPGEACDPGIESGMGACPDSCDGSAECGTLVLEGTAAACSAQCVVEPNACGDADGCCPVGCDSLLDNDCTNTCGDGTIESPEICDGDCPTTCENDVACTTGTLSGSPDTCDAQCLFEPVTACQNDDGCCPEGCTPDDDNDCSGSCGDGTRDPGELCDGDCPTLMSCDDGDACTRNTLVGSAATCSAQCSTSPVTACQSGDGCCPSGCSFSNDTDCNCQPSTCAQLGVECGTTGDGCGSTLDCGGCTNGMCSNNVCIENDSTGDSCTSDGQCGSGGACLTESNTGLPGGYCTEQCSSNSGCASNNCWDENGLCVDSCFSDNECRTNYECYDWTGDGIRECGPVANGTGSVGDSCSGYTDCSGGQDGFCIDNVDFSAGYCTLGCQSDLDCPSGSNCLDSGICVDNCTSSCRTGYGCYDVDGDGQSECWPSGTGVRSVGESCSRVQDCDGDEFAVCARSTQDDPNSWPNGYCILLCGNDGTTCPAGTECFDPDGTGDNSFCLQTCSSSGDCRSGYTCDSSLGTTEDVCIY